MSHNFEYDNHHTLNTKRSFNAHRISRLLRENSSLIAYDIARQTHELLHRNTTPVPVPPWHTLIRLNNDMPPGLPILNGIDEFCRIVETANNSPRVKPLEVRLNELCIDALQDQVPYIREGLNTTKYII